jgi:phosphate transport system protein
VTNKHIVHSYDKELRSLSESIVAMGKLVREIILIADKSFQDNENDYVALAKATDKKVNNFDLQIEQQATSLLALRQPMAIDLRQVISALKIAVILERMGDLGKNTTKRAKKINAPLPEDWTNDIRNMADIIANMLSDVLDAFKEFNKEKAEAVWAKDAEVDEIYYSLMGKLQSDMVTSPQNIPSTLQIIFAVRNIERIGDYVTKLAKIVYYIVSGERVTKTKKPKTT